MNLRTVNSFHFDDGSAVVIDDADHDSFEALETRTGSRSHGRALLIEGRWYVLHPSCPDEGMAAWSATQSPEDAAREAAIMRMPQADRELAFPGFQTFSQRVAKKQADDAAAQARAAEARAKAAKPAEVPPKGTGAPA